MFVEFIFENNFSDLYLYSEIKNVCIKFNLEASLTDFLHLFTSLYKPIGIKYSSLMKRACLISKKVRQACLLMWIYGGKIQYMEIVKVSIK